MQITINNQRDVITQYIYAKDHNRPHLMVSTFTPDAHLEMRLNTQNIAFPSESIGLDAITETLVSNFGRTYENVYTFCASDSLTSDEDTASCSWLVVMTEKNSGQVRVGCGQYDWHFSRGPLLLADRLCITIDEMQVLEPHLSPDILAGVSALPYPWCDAATMINTMPELEQLQPILKIMR